MTMSMAVSTSRVPCPVCGVSATLTVRTAFGTDNESSSMSLACDNGCQPDDGELAGHFPGSQTLVEATEPE
jgi:hypothetical protein